MLTVVRATGRPRGVAPEPFSEVYSHEHAAEQGGLLSGVWDNRAGKAWPACFFTSALPFPCIASGNVP